MHQPQKISFLVIFFLLSIFFWQTSGCKKEHSCEGCIAPRSQPPHDSIPTPSPPVTTIFPGCSLCTITDEPALSTWSFISGDTYVCGVVSDCAFIGGHTTFTFFGPSACSEDTGLVMTVYLPLEFDKDMNNVTTDNAAFYYYDNQAPQDIFIRLPVTPFSTTIQHYNSATGLTTGTFQGTVFKADGTTAFIGNGKFKIILK